MDHQVNVNTAAWQLIMSPSIAFFPVQLDLTCLYRSFMMNKHENKSSNP